MNYIHSLILLVLIFTACNPVATATQTTLSEIRTELPPQSPTLYVSTPTIAPISTAVDPTFTPAPTSTAIASLRPGQPLILAMIHMSDEQNGWGIDVGEHIVYTTDGGLTWKDVTPLNGAYRDSGFFALDANTAWATPYQQGCATENCAPTPNNASVWRTTDGGNTWQEGHVCLQSQECNFDFDVPPEAYIPITLEFVDETTGWLLIVVDHMMNQDRYRLYKTMDSGAHWTPVIDSLTGPMTARVTGLAFQDNNTGWMSTSEIFGAVDPMPDWSIYQSTDAGQTWNTIQLPEPIPFQEKFAPDTLWCGAEKVQVIRPNGIGVTIHCIVLENELRPAYDFYFHSTDGGKHWVSWPVGVDVMFINPLVGWRLTFETGMGAYDLDKTRDGGRTWQPVKTLQWNGNLEFLNEATGWAIATNENTTALVHTTDGGKTWEEIKPVVTAN